MTFEEWWEKHGYPVDFSSAMTSAEQDKAIAKHAWEAAQQAAIEKIAHHHDEDIEDFRYTLDRMP